MIHGVFGKLGSGKGLLAIDIIAKELSDGFRDVVTNVPIRIQPWVNGQGVPQLGLRAYLIAKLYPMSEEDVDEMLKRVRCMEDIEDGHDMFLWRRDGDTGDWFKLTVNKHDEKGRPERFDAEEIKKRHAQPVLCVTDEAWQFYPNNGGWSRVPLLTFFSKQQRKLRDEWYIVTQHPSDVDMSLWNIAQDFWMCRNHGMERMGVFRQPAMFRVIVYLTNPAKGGAMRSHEFYRVLDKKLSQCYDTTAGVGIGGGHKGDANQKRKGFHFAWIFVLLALFVVGLASVIPVMRYGAKGFFFKTLSGGRYNHTNSVPPVRSRAALLTNQVSVFEPSVSVLPGRAVLDLSHELNTSLVCYGCVVLSGHATAMLSDGRSVDESDGLTVIKKKSIVLNGQEIPIRMANMPDYVAEPVPYYEQPLPSPPRPVNDAIIIPFGQYHERVPPSHLNGVGNRWHSFNDSSSGENHSVE